MGKGKTRTYTIEVERTVREVLDLITRKRGYIAVSVYQKVSSVQIENLRNEGLAWFEIHNKTGGDKPDWPKFTPKPIAWRGIAIGVPLDTRDCDDEFIECLMSFPTINHLYEFCEGKTLRFEILAESEGEANRIWLREMLRLGEDPGKWYMSDDFSSVTVRLQRISEGSESNEAGVRPTEEPPASVDIAGFEVYDALRGWLEREAKSYCYGDDVFVEYSISSDEGVARYCATEFYSNHNWSRDPANLLVVRFCGEVVSGACPQEGVRFLHPAKMTVRKASGERFLVDSLATSNDVEVKWYSGKGEEKRPDEALSADRIMDNPVDFNHWVVEHRVEIDMA